MSVELNRKRDSLDIEMVVLADLNDGKLCITELDYGEQLESLIGESSYEKNRIFNKENTDKFFKYLMIEHDSNILKKIESEFSGDDAINKIEDFCMKNGIVFMMFDAYGRNLK